MNNFCEECGNRLNSGDLFCQECGAKVPNNVESTHNISEKDLATSFFKDKNLGRSHNLTQAQVGILLTNFKRWEQKFGAAQTQNLAGQLTQYLKAIQQWGRYYLVLDVSDNYLKSLNDASWQKQVQLLVKAIKEVKKRLNSPVAFLMIFGGHEIIPMPLFTHPHSDGNDKDIDSDLPYSTLSVLHPLDKGEARTPVLPVGRIPSGSSTSVNDLVRLLNNTIAGMDNFPINKTFGLSTYCWQQVSNYINQHVAHEQLYISPALTMQNIKQYYPLESNLLYFNLHGSNNAPQWFGQKDSDYPPAFAPQVIAINSELNVIGVEACYGARFIGLSNTDSIVLSALANKTIAFAGSSRIAWGPSVPPMNLADVVVHDFLKNIQNGEPSGVAFLKARKHAFENTCKNDPLTSLATMMEFNLFGDPAFTINAKKTEIPTYGGAAKGFDADQLTDLSDQEIEKAEQKPMSGSPSVYDLVTRAVDEAQRKITELINKQVWDKYPDFKDIQPSFVKYNFEGKSYNRLTYSKSLPYFEQSVLINTDDKGQVLTEMESK